MIDRDKLQQQTKQESLKPKDYRKYGIYLILGSSAFFVIGILRGIAQMNLVLCLVELGAGFLFLISGFFLYLKGRTRKLSMRSSKEGQK